MIEIQQTSEFHEVQSSEGHANEENPAEIIGGPSGPEVYASSGQVDSSRKLTIKT